jgi:hypothetical protein
MYFLYIIFVVVACFVNSSPEVTFQIALIYINSRQEIVLFIGLLNSC